MALVVDRFEIMSNCYAVRTDRGAPESAVIDPGGAAKELRGELERRGTRAAAILVTHADVDHVSGVAELAEATGAPVYAPQPELMPAIRAQGGGFLPPPRPYTVTTTVGDGDAIEVAGIEFEVIAIPGHSPDHVAYYAGGALFSGDLLMQNSVGRVDFPGGDWDTLVGSIRTLMERFPPDTVVYPGHGAPTTLGDERARNPFLTELRAS
jgi:glyoxylase-like metal-dependent hydrolase (beta-lactamase superfamily II)